MSLQVWLVIGSILAGNYITVMLYLEYLALCIKKSLFLILKFPFYVVSFNLFDNHLKQLNKYLLIYNYKREVFLPTSCF